jgi:tetratricopeptide (TPR) repeat protein
VISGLSCFSNIQVVRGAARFAPLFFVSCVLCAAGAEDPGRRLAELRREIHGAHPPTAFQVSSRLNDIALEYLESGEAPRAIELLSEAVARDPDNGTALANLILTYLKHEDFEFAGFYLEQATQTTVRRQPNPDVYRTIGDFYAARHRLEDAVMAWDYYILLGGADPSVLARVDRTRRELSVTPGQRLLESDRFALYTDAVISPEVAASAEEHLEREYRRQSTFFATELAGRQTVILYGGRAYFSLVSVPNWISGIFDGKIRISLEPVEGWTSQLAAVLSHELAHAFIRKASGGRAPGWLHEGLAQWFEGKRILRGEFRQALARQPFYSLAEMEGNLTRGADRASRRSSYVEALGLIEFLIQERGEGALACVVGSLGEGTTLANALRRETGYTPVELLSGFRGWANLKPGSSTNDSFTRVE